MGGGGGGGGWGGGGGGQLVIIERWPEVTNMSTVIVISVWFVGVVCL